MRKLMFNGRRSVDFGVKISDEDPFGAPARITQAVTIPGRNGAFIIDEGNYENKEKIYHSAAFRTENLPWARMVAIKDAAEGSTITCSTGREPASSTSFSWYSSSVSILPVSLPLW